ncbi:hypothetical protein Tco_0425145 [Tanacetum coccineum]
MSNYLYKNLKEIKAKLIKEVQEMLNIFESIEQQVKEKSPTENILQNKIDRLLEVYLTSEIQDCVLLSVEKQKNKLLKDELEKSSSDSKDIQANFLKHIKILENDFKRSEAQSVESSNSVRRPKSKGTKSKNRVLKNTKSSSAYVRKISNSVSIDSNKCETKDSNVCQTNASVSNSKTVNDVNDGSNIVCVSYGKDVFLLSHEKFVDCHALSRNYNVKRALFTTPVAAKSKNLRATSVVAKSRLSVAKTPKATNKSHIRIRSTFNTPVTTQKWAAKLSTLPSAFVSCDTDLDNLFGPLYEEYYATSSQEVSDNFAANTLDNEHTSSSSSIVIEEDEAPQIVSSSAEQVSNEPNSPVLKENTNELV